MPHIAVIGNYGGWSSEHLADCVARATGKRLLVDMVETPDGPLVFEVTAFGGFKGMETARNMDGARCYVDYVLKRMAS